MDTCRLRLAVVACAALTVAGCGNKETKEALQKANALGDQKQYEQANTVLLDALRAREATIRSAHPTDAVDAADTKEVNADPEILKLERAQVGVYLHLERADKAWAVYSDILTGNPGDSVVNDTLKDKDPLIRAGGVRVLGLTGKPDAILALTAALKDDDKDVRSAVVTALGAIKDPQAVDALLPTLKDPYWFVRSEAAEALRQQHDPRSINALIDAVADEDKNVESSAEGALLTLCTPPAATPDAFVARLNDPNPKIALISAVCLAVLKDPRAVPPLLKLAASSDLTTRLQAIKGLGESGDPSVIPTLRETLKDPDINMRGWSIIGLGSLKDQASLPALRAFAADPAQPASIQGAAKAAINNITGGAPPPPAPNP